MNSNLHILNAATAKRIPLFIVKRTRLAAEQGLRERLDVDAIEDETRIEEIAAQYQILSGDMANMMDRIQRNEFMRGELNLSL